MVISPYVAWSAATTSIAPQVSYRTAVRVGQAGLFYSHFFGTSPLRFFSLLAQPPCSPTHPLKFPFPFANTSMTPFVLTLAHDPTLHTALSIVPTKDTPCLRL